MADVIEHVWRNGGLFQEWSEHFDIELWTTAIEACGLDFDWYAYRHRHEDEVLPWDHLSAGLHKDFLWQDWRDALDEVGLEDCRWTRSEEHTSELQSLMRISYAVFCLQTKKNHNQ